MLQGPQLFEPTTECRRKCFTNNSLRDAQVAADAGLLHIGGKAFDGAVGISLSLRPMKITVGGSSDEMLCAGESSLTRSPTRAVPQPPSGPLSKTGLKRTRAFALPFHVRI